MTCIPATHFRRRRAVFHVVTASIHSTEGASHLRGIHWIAVFLATLVALAAPARATTVAHLWSKSFGSTSGHDYAFDVAVDALGNVVVVGTFVGTINLGGSNLVSAGQGDVFVARYTAAGQHLWSARYGGTGNDEARKVGIDGSGHIVVAGKFSGTANFGGSNLASYGQEDVFVARYRSTGAHVWSTNHGGTGNDTPGDIAVDASGSFMLTGSFFNTGYFGYSLALTSSGLYDIFLVKYDSNGFSQWGFSYGGASHDYATGVGLDAAGNVYLTGRYQGTINLGGAALASAGAEDAFLAKYNATGAHQWSQRFGGTDWDAAYALAVDATGNPVITGYFLGAVNFGGGALANAGSGDVFVAKYSTTGAHQWSRSGGGTGYEQPYGIAMDAYGNVAVIGWFPGTANFGGANLVSAGLDDVFLARYGPAGAHLWSARLGGPDFDQALSVACAASGAVVAAGTYAVNTNYGGTTFTSAGGADFVVAHYGPGTAEPTIRAIADVRNDQGRRVKITIGPSGYDTPSAARPITAYEAYLRDDALPAKAGAAAGAVLDMEPGPAPGAMPSRLELLAQGWEFVGSVPASGTREYLLGALTDADSTIALGQHYSAFFIRAATSDPVVFHDSVVDSGYSVDNLAPSSPANLIYSGSALSWLASAAADFDYFSVYGSASATFDVSAVLIGQTTGTRASVAANPYSHYYVTATDFSGNEGLASQVNTSSSDVVPAPAYRLGVNAYPNPFNPRTTIRYDVPSSGRVVVAIFDVSGSRVTTLVDRSVEPGSYTVGWDGRDERGTPASTGAYFVRMEMGGNMTARKIALVK